MAYSFLNMVCKNLPFIIVPITPLFLFIINDFVFQVVHGLRSGKGDSIP